MTTPVTAFVNLKDEIEDRIVALTPNRTIRAEEGSFSVYPDKAVKSKPILEWTGRARTFVVGDPVDMGHWAVGWTETQKLYHIPVVFVYRRTPIWTMAAIDDMHQIFHDILSNPPSVAGVANRYFSESQPTVTKNPDGPWDYYTLTLMAYLSVTATDT